MNKFEKIDLVRRLGLNTETNILIKSDNVEETSRIVDFIQENKIAEVSIRTMGATPEKSRDGTKTPHYPIVNVEDVLPTVKKIVKDGFYAIIATPIDPKDALLAGAVLKTGDTYCIELVRGQYTVRRVTHEGIIDIDIMYDDRDKTQHVKKLPTQEEWPYIDEIIKEVVKVPFSSCIIELSYYRVPVGCKYENVIIWDISSSGSHGSTVELEAYYRKK